MYHFNPQGMPREAFEQSEIFYDKRGRQHRIATMNPAFAANAWAKLLKVYGVRSTTKPLMQALANQANGARVRIGGSLV